MAFFKLCCTIFVLGCLTVPLSYGANSCPFNVEGLIAPVFTPIGKNGSLDLSIISRYARYIKDKGLDGICVAGFIGEGPKLSLANVKSLTTAWLKAAEPLGLSVIVLIGGRPFPDVVELARFAEYVGVDAISTLPDLFYKPQTVEDLIYATEIVANAAPNTPLVYFDVPRYTGVYVDVAEFFTQATAKIPTFKGLTIDNCDDIIRVLPLLKDDQKIFICNSSYVAPAVYLGIEDFIIPELNLFPELIKEIINLGEQGLLNETNRRFDELTAFANSISSNGYDVPAYKATMTLITGIDVGPPRKPEAPISQQEEYELILRLKDRGEDIVYTDK